MTLLASVWAWQAPTPDDLVRQGNAAYAHGEFATALRLYQQAEERTDDPGLVAFNEAAALYQLGRFREAELCYTRCREDATGPRLARLLYGLGNCLVQQAQPGDAARLDRAIGFYDECLTQSGADEDLLADTRHNRELAVQLRAKEPPAGPKPNSSGDPSEPPSGNRPNGPGEDERGGSPIGKNGARQQAVAKQRPDGTPVPVDEPPPPGKGNLPPVPDQDELASMSTAEALAHLEEALARIRQEQKEFRQRASASPSRQVPDW
jgi:tetratricopeptide (TPR) repeat protein